MRDLLLKTCLSILFVLISVSSAFAIGIAPVLIEVDGILVDSIVEREFFISRADSQADEQVVLNVSGSAAPYISIHDGDIINLPSNEQQTHVPFFIDSDGLSPGLYEADIRLKLVMHSDTGTNLVLPSLISKVRFRVTDIPRREILISQTMVPGTDELSALKFAYVIYNKGNVTIRPDKIEIVVDDDLRYSAPSWKIPDIPPFSEKHVFVSTDLILPAGIYSPLLYFYDVDDSVIFESDAHYLQVQDRDISELYQRVCAFLYRLFVM